jgi:4-amino-4-deoxy-L-arabinose transferase-like glycosyltransferase
MIKNPISGLPKRSAIVIACILFVILGMELVFSIRQQSQTFDESFHILAGNQYWKHRDFGANPEHPPLVKLLSTIPLLGMGLNQTEIVEGPTKGFENLRESIAFLYDNSVDVQTILLRTRLTCIIFPLLLAVLLFVCCFEMFGQGTALLGLTLLIFEPNILANGALVTTDLAATCFIFTSVYAFYRYLKSPNWKRLLLCSLCVSLAFASKHSCLILIPILILLLASDLIFFRYHSNGTPSFKRQAIRYGAALVFIFIIATVGLWAFYSFRFAARPDGFLLSPGVEAFAGTLDNKFWGVLIAALWRIRILPESFLWGLTDVMVGVGGGRPMYLLGQVYAEGKWFFFPLVFLMKSTLPFLLLLAALPLAARKIAAPRELVFMILPPVFYLAVSIFSGMNLGVRHILPIFPFLIVLAALCAIHYSDRFRFAFIVTMILLLGHAASSLRAYPNYLTYSNEIVGSSGKTYQVMSGSDVDWGQGLIQTSSYLSERGITDCWFAYMVLGIDPSKYGVPCRLLPAGLGFINGLVPPTPPPVINGTILISANEATGRNWGPGEINPYQQFLDQVPNDIIANSILVFHGTFDVSLVAATVHSARSRQFLEDNLINDALEEARIAARLAPDSAEMQAGLCLAMAQSGESDLVTVCQKALDIARRVHPEYQFKNLPNVKAVAEIYSQGIQ